MTLDVATAMRSLRSRRSDSHLRQSGRYYSRRKAHYALVALTLCLCIGGAQSTSAQGNEIRSAIPGEEHPMTYNCDALVHHRTMDRHCLPETQDKTTHSSLSVLKYLQSISGKQTVAGIHNREPNGSPTLQSDEIARRTGKRPGLWSGDFLFKAEDVKNRWVMIRECKRQWDQGSIVQLMAHVAPPNQPEECEWEGGILSHLSDDQWKDLVTDGGALNRAWKARLDGYAVYLQYLKENGVQVLFRPLHEMNQGRFWWGGRKGAEGTGKLYRLTRDYLTKEKGLTNLIWVWDMQDMSRDFADYNPGNSYWDVFAFDVYGPGYDRSWYEYILPIVGEKPMAIGECEKLPTPELLTAQSRWCFFMSWAELTFTSNTNEQILALYRAPNVITRDRLPDLRHRAVSR